MELSRTTARLFAVAGPIVSELVIVVDGVAADLEAATIQALSQRWGQRMTILTNPKRLGAAASRNRGADHATSKYLCFLDDDVWPEKGWADAVCAAMDAGWRCATGPVTSDELSILSRAREMRYLDRYRGLGHGDRVDFLAGGNALIDRSAFMDARGFPSRRVGSDSALLQRLGHVGVHGRFASGMVVRRRHDRGVWVAVSNAWLAGMAASREPMQRPPRLVGDRGLGVATAYAVNAGLWAVRTAGWIGAQALSATSGPKDAP